MKKDTIEQSTYYVYLDLINSLLINYKGYDLCNKQVHNLSPKVFQEYGSILLDKGVNIKTISELLGHKNITTTYNIYIGVDEDSKSKAVKVFDE